MTAPDVHASAPHPAGGRRARKPAARTKAARAAYAYAGSIADLPKAVDKGVRSERIRAVVIPTTAAAENALRTSTGFSRIPWDEDRQMRVGATGPARAADRIEGSGDARIAMEAYEPDARARAILRGRKFAEADLKASGGAYGMDDVRALLNGISRQAIDKRVNEGTLLAVPGPGGGRRFPTIQFDEHGHAVSGLKAVSRALGVSSPWAILNFLVNGHDRLAGKRPIDLLREGEIDEVVAAAAGVGVHGA